MNQIHPLVQKFDGCYKQVVNHRRSGSSKKDLMTNAHMIYSQDTVKKIEVEHAWLLLKEEWKFDAEFMGKSSKRTNVFASGGYSLSFNLNAPNEVEEYDTTSPMSRLIGERA